MLKHAVREMTQVYADLHTRGVPVRYLDVGGGLGVQLRRRLRRRRSRRSTTACRNTRTPSCSRCRRSVRCARRAGARADLGERPRDHRAPLGAGGAGAGRASTRTHRRASALPDKPHGLVQRLLEALEEVRDADGERRGAARGVSRRAGSDAAKPTRCSASAISTSIRRAIVETSVLDRVPRDPRRPARRGARDDRRRSRTSSKRC